MITQEQLDNLSVILREMEIEFTKALEERDYRAMSEIIIEAYEFKNRSSIKLITDEHKIVSSTNNCSSDFVNRMNLIKGYYFAEMLKDNTIVLPPEVINITKINLSRDLLVFVNVKDRYLSVEANLQLTPNDLDGVLEHTRLSVGVEIKSDGKFFIDAATRGFLNLKSGDILSITARYNSFDITKYRESIFFWRM